MLLYLRRPANNRPMKRQLICLLHTHKPNTLYLPTCRFGGILYSSLLIFLTTSCPCSCLFRRLLFADHTFIVGILFWQPTPSLSPSFHTQQIARYPTNQRRGVVVGLYLSFVSYLFEGPRFAATAFSTTLFIFILYLRGRMLFISVSSLSCAHSHA